MSSDLQFLHKLKVEGTLPPIITENTNVIHFLSDLINHRLKHKTKKPLGTFMKVFFDHKAIEQVNLTSLLHKVNDAIPQYFKLKSAPTVLYTRSPTD